MALVRCVLAVLVSGAFSIRVPKRRAKGTKQISGVPILNYDQAYRGGNSLSGTDPEEEWIVWVGDDVTDAQIQSMCQAASRGCNLVGHPSEAGIPFFEMRGSEEDLKVVIEAGKNAVQFIETDSEAHIAVVETTEVESDVEGKPWGLVRVGVNHRSSDGAGVTVFILDTGVRTSHNDFGGRAKPGIDYTSGRFQLCNGNTNCAVDVHGHGTHCAGSVGGNTYGVAPGVAIRSAKVLGNGGSGSGSWIIGAVDYIASSKIRPVVASMSLGGKGIYQAYNQAITRANNAGVTVVVAAGNDNSDACNFSPAFVPAAITVGSTDMGNRRSSFSNYGQCVQIWAPGSNILSASHRGDSASATMSGTSMACPHVAGGAALILKNAANTNVVGILQANSKKGMITDLKGGDKNMFLWVGGGGATPPRRRSYVPPRRRSYVPPRRRSNQPVTYYAQPEGVSCPGDRYLTQWQCQQAAASWRVAFNLANDARFKLRCFHYGGGVYWNQAYSSHKQYGGGVCKQSR